MHHFSEFRGTAGSSEFCPLLLTVLQLLFSLKLASECVLAYT